VKQRAFDYIVVGAGSAGCVLAARLSEDPAVSVLLLEAGGSDWNPLISAPGGLLPIMLSGAYSWGYQSAPQQQLNQRTLYLPRGKVVGGSSSINGMVYCRGVPADFDEWAALGNPGWSYAEVLPYFKRSETYHGGANAWHGDRGPVQVTRPGVRHPFARAFVDAGQQAGYPYNDDTNGASREGFGPTDITVGRGRRSSAATAYLKPARRRQNLTVVTGVLARRILLDAGRATGVEVSRGDALTQYLARREVIVCGGALNTPQLLMLSGIGDPAHLQSVGIECHVALPGVGQNLQDHLAITVKYASTEPISLFKYLNPLRGALALGQYMLLRSGPLADSGMEAVGFVSSDEAGQDPDLKLLLLMALYRDHGRELLPQHGFGVHINVIKPESTGQLRLASADPAVPPVIDQNYLASERDLRVLRKGVRIAREVFRQPAFDRYRAEEIAPGPAVVSDEAIDAYIRNEADADYHSCGTCRMGRDDMSVVDAELRVHGVQGLRVADASVMPRLVSGNTNMAVLMVAEKAADLIAGRAPPAP
jgi:choline dehydrogenase